MLRCKASAIENLHGWLINDFAPFLEVDFVIDRPPDQRHSTAWAHQHYIGAAAFDLWPDDYQFSDTAHRSPIAPLAQVAERFAVKYWVAWGEEWIKDRKYEDFRLHHAGFKILRGRPLAVRQLLFRAEWPGNDSAVESGHPHWHFDLVQAGISLSHIHFGMSGWKWTDRHPTCWQCYPQEIGELRTWAAKTLEYIRHELINYPPSEPDEDEGEDA